MLKIGIIGAGNISNSHIKAYSANPNCEVVAISDIDEERVKLIADKYDIKTTYTDYHDILNDKSIDAVSICTPTFTHKQIALEAIKSDKHILCEKPPACSAEEIKEMRDAHKGSSKVLMFAMVCRFRDTVQYLKEYIDAGKMGKIVSGEAARYSKLSMLKGWFAKRELGGGTLRDECIHELDLVLYLMGYPKPKTVFAFESHLNNDLAAKMRSKVGSYNTADKNQQANNTEDVLKAIVTLDNDACITVKAGKVFLLPKDGVYTEIHGTKAGAIMKPWLATGALEITEVTDNMFVNNSTPAVDDGAPFDKEIEHFVDCCTNNAECIVKPDEAVTLIEIIDAIYKSAETGEPVFFN